MMLIISTHAVSFYPFGGAVPTVMIRLPEVLRRTGLSRSQTYALIAENQFPRQIELSTRAVGWLEDDIEGWIVGRINRSKAKLRSRKVG